MSVTTENRHPSWMFWKKKRHLILFLTFIGMTKMYILKVSVSMAVVAMNSPYNTTLDNGTVQEVQDFYWSSKMQGVFLSSFFYGQVSSQIFGGWMGSRLGGTKLFGLGMVLTSLLTIVTPPIAFANFYLLLITRALMGFSEGMTLPCIHEIWARWGPPQERSTLVAVSLSGVPIGTVVGLQSGGIIAEYLGWEYIFYITGMLGILWYLIWISLVKDRPEYDSNISNEELKYITDSIGLENEKEKIKHPWKKFLTSMPVWAISVGIVCANWGHTTFITQLPLFMKDVYDVRLAKSGLITSVPYFFMGLSMQFSGKLADWILKENILTTTQVRKTFVCTTLVVQAAALMLSTKLESVTGFILCLVVILGSEGFAVLICANVLDLAPQHASVIYGLTLTLGSTPGILSPLLTGFIVTDQSKEQWKMVFYITTSMYLFGAIFYGLFSSGELQPWANDGTETPTEKPKNKKSTC